MRFLAILLVLMPLGARATTVEDLMKEMERRDLKFKQEIERRNLEIREIHRRDVSMLNAVIDKLQAKQNDTEELEARVSDLEESVADLEVDVVALTDDMDNVESANLIQDDRINTLEAEIFDNENDIEALVGNIEALEDTTAGLQLRVTDLEGDVTVLDQRVDDLEAGGGGGNNTDLTERVEALEEVTSQMSDDISELQATTEDFETRIVELEAVIIEPWNACESSPCNNGATCVDVNVDTFICSCPDGYFGVACGDSYADTSFLATFDVLGVTPTDPIVFNHTVLNPGGHYNNQTGIYTVPLDGDYEFIVKIWSRGDSGIRGYLNVDDVRVTNGYGETTLNNPNVDTIVILRLTSGQQVWVEPNGIAEMYGSSSSEGMYSWFSGHLIHAI